MRKFVICIVALFAVICFGIVGCNKSNDNRSYPDMKLSFESLEIEVYESVTLTAKNCKSPKFSSSDVSVAKVTSAGVITGLTVGETDIVVKAGTNEKVCRIIVVDKGNVPVIETQVDDTISLFTNDTLALNPMVTFKGLATQTSFSYSSSDEAVVSVSKNGVVTAKSLGNATVVISSEYCGKTLEKILEVNVVENITIELGKYSYNLYTSDVFGGETSLTLNPKVYVDGVIQENADISYVYDQEVLDVVDGVVNVKINDSVNTTVTVEYKDAQGQVQAQTRVKVNVVFPIMDMTKELHYYVDNWKDSERDKELGKDEIVFPYLDVFNGKTVSKIFDFTTGENVDLNYIPTTGILTDAKITEGKKIWQIRNDEFGYLVSVTVVDRVVMNADELKAILAVATDESIVLGADITNAFDVVNSSKDFSGVFDGAGHTIDGLSFGASQGGLFMRISSATVKNVVFKNVNVSATRVSTPTTKTYGHSLIGQSISSTVENIYAEITSDSNEYEGGLFNNIAVGVTVKNAVIVYRNSTAGTQVGVLARAASASLTAENVYVICSPSIKLIAAPQSGVSVHGVNLQYESVKNIVERRNLTTLTGVPKQVLDELSDEYGNGYANDDFNDLPV